MLTVGLSKIPGVDLGFAGMPGCDLHVALDGFVPLAGSNHQAVWQLAIPDDLRWVGQRFYTQALVLDTGAGNTLGAVVGDAAEAVIGHW